MNEFVPFAYDVTAYTLTPGEWAALTSFRLTGFQPGIVSGERFNTVMRQASTGAAGTARFAEEHGGNDMLDNGDIQEYADGILAAVRNIAAAEAARILGDAVPGDGGGTPVSANLNTKTIYSSLVDGLAGVRMLDTGVFQRILGITGAPSYSNYTNEWLIGSPRPTADADKFEIRCTLFAAGPLAGGSSAVGSWLDGDSNPAWWVEDGFQAQIRISIRNKATAAVVINEKPMYLQVNSEDLGGA